MAFLDPSKPLASSRVDVTQYGVNRTLGYSGSEQNSSILQQLADQVVGEPGTTATTTAKVLYFPGSPFSSYYLSRPLWINTENTYLEGDGPDQTRISSRFSYPGIIFGLQKNPSGHTLTPANFVPNALTTGIAGQTYGIAMIGNTLVAPSQTISFGPPTGGWPSVRQLHIGGCFDFSSATGDEPLFGISVNGQPKPIRVRRQGNGLMVYFACQDGLRRSFFVWSPMAAGVCRFDIQIDLVTATVSAWINGVQVEASDRTFSTPNDNSGGYGLRPDFLPTSNLSFVANDYLHFRIAGEGRGLEASDVQDVSDMAGNGLGHSIYPQFVVHALTIRSSLHYKNLGVGQPAQRIDGQAENDYGHYFAGNDILWGYWPSFDTQDVIANRCVPFQSVVANQCMLWLDPLSGDVGSQAINYCGASDMTIDSGGSAGITVMWGHLQHGEFSNLVVNGGNIGMGTIHVGANFPIKIRDCTVGGYDSAISTYSSILDMRDLDILRSGRASFRFIGGSISLRDSMVRGNANADGSGPEYIIKYHTANDGQGIKIDNVSHDYEGGPYPSKAVLDVEALSWNGPTYRTPVVVDNLSGGISPTGVGVDLHSMGPSTPSGHLGGSFSGRGINLAGNGRPVIRMDDPSFWTVSMSPAPAGSIVNTTVVP